MSSATTVFPVLIVESNVLSTGQKYISAIPVLRGSEILNSG